MRFFWILGISLAITTLSACSSDSHSSSEPEDTQDSSSSASLDDVDDILDKSSASTEKEGTKTEDGGDEQTIKSSGSTAYTEVNGLMRSACDTKDGESVLEALDVINERPSTCLRHSPTRTLTRENPSVPKSSPPTRKF